MKNFIAKIALVLGLNASFALASGIPTFDAVGLATSVKQFMEQAKQYQQMITEYKELATQTAQMVQQNANFDALKTEQGIGLTLNQILGESKALIDQAENLYDGAKIAEDTFQETADITQVCKFLGEKSPAFYNKVQQTAKTLGGKGTLENTINACIAIANNDTSDLTQIINELTNQAIEVQMTNNEKAQELRHEAKTITTALNYLKGKQNSQKATKILAFYEAYIQGDETNPYSKKKFDNDLKTLAKQMNQVNNTKQAQAITNAMLLKLLEVAQRQYELQVNYNNMMAMQQMQGGENVNQLDYTAEIVYEKKFEDIFEEELKQAESNDDGSGIPSFREIFQSAFKD